MTVTERLKELLQQRGYGAQKELSQYISVTPTTLNNWLKYDRSIPSEYIVGISKFFGVSVYYLLTGQDEIKSDFKAYDVDGSLLTLSPEQQELTKLRANSALTKRILEVVEDAQEKRGG